MMEKIDIIAPVRLLVTTRIANMVAGLFLIPVLIHYLGGEGFAAWAILLATSAVFFLLSMGMPPTLVKYMAVPIREQDWARCDHIFKHVVVVILVAFGAFSPVVILLADAAAQTLRLPAGQILSAGEMIVFVYVAVVVTAILQTGTDRLYAARNFRAVASFSFFQPLVSNCAAAVAAALTRSLEVVVICFWCAQISVVLVSFHKANRMRGKSVAFRFELSMVRELFSHGIKTQTSAWAQVINFQFDKFIIASLVGLWAVAPYEVANRGVQALRSIPSSGVDSFLPAAAISHAEGMEATWQSYQKMLRLAAYAVIVFMIAPLTVAPLFLYAWTGEMGYLGRWAFVALMLGAASNVLAVPAIAMVQVAGRAGIQARAAFVSILINVPLSLVLVLKWGLLGGALASALAMVTNSILMIVDMHSYFRKPVLQTLKLLSNFWPLLLVCFGCAVAAYVPFEWWFATQDPTNRFSRGLRLYPALSAGLMYGFCIALLLAVQLLGRSFDKDELDMLRSVLRVKWLTALLERRKQDGGLG